jgi:sugar phosphate isomerase/epimerase
MEVSIATSFNYKISFEKQIELLKLYNYHYISLGTNYEHCGLLNNDINKTKELLQNNSINIDSIHGYNLDKSDTLEINQMIIEKAILLQVPIIVLHCSSFMINPDTIEDRKKSILKKIPWFEKSYYNNGIRFAFENVMPGITTELLKYILDKTNEEIFGFCYDSAHDQINGPNTFELLKNYKKKLIKVHLSDRIKEFVDHVIPGEGFIDFNEIETLIAQSEYNSPLLMEVMMEHSKYKDENMFLKITKDQGEKINNSIMKKRHSKNGQNCT